MTEQRFAVCRQLLDTRPWDFFMMVEIGLDRMHHAFWRFLDPEHPRHEPNHRYRDAIRNYYIYLDEEIGELLEALRRGHDRPRRLRSRRAADAGRDLRQRMARAGGIPGTGRGARRKSRHSARPALTGAGREPGARAATTAGCASTSRAGAAGDRVGERVRAAARRARAGVSSSCPGPTVRRSGPVLPPRGAVARAARDPARPDRLLRRPGLAQQRKPRPRPALDLRQRHRSGRRQPRPQRAVCDHRSGKTGRAARRPAIYDIAPNDTGQSRPVT